jgi:hypothetical protein
MEDSAMNRRGSKLRELIEDKKEKVVLEGNIYCFSNFKNSCNHMEHRSKTLEIHSKLHFE